MKKNIIHFLLILILFSTIGSSMVEASTQSIDLQARAIGSISNPEASYLVNLSFKNGLNSNQISKWELIIQCSKDITVITVPGDACNDPFIMGDSSRIINDVLNKEFWFRNYSNREQKVQLLLNGYNLSGRLIGTDNEVISIPPTSKGPQTWSGVALLTPNGGEDFKPGKSVKVEWKAVSNGAHTFDDKSKVKIMLLKDRQVVKTYNVKNKGKAKIKLPKSELGDNYKIMVTVYSNTGYEGTAMADESDAYFSIQSAKSSGLVIEDVIIGSGKEVKSGDTLLVHYRGTLEKGVVFDSSYERGQPFIFKIGVGRVIKGWDEGLIGMKVGGKRKLIIPASLAYGKEGVVGSIPANAPLFFDVELIGIK